MRQQIADRWGSDLMFQSMNLRGQHVAHLRGGVSILYNTRGECLDRRAATLYLRHAS